MLYKELYKESNELAKERLCWCVSGLQRLKKSRRQKKNIKNTSGRRHSRCRKQAAVHDLWADDAIQKTEFKRSRNM